MVQELLWTLIYLEIMDLISICFQRRDVYFRKFNNIVQGSETSGSIQWRMTKETTKETTKEIHRTAWEFQSQTKRARRANTQSCSRAPSSIQPIHSFGEKEENAKHPICQSALGHHEIRNKHQKDNRGDFQLVTLVVTG